MRKLRNLTRLRQLAINPESRLAIIIRVIAAFQIALMAATWPLWLGHPDFPQVPLLDTGIHPAVGNMLSVVVILAAILILSDAFHQPVRQFLQRALRWTALAAGLFLTVLNQHRLQPWNWLFLVFLIWSVAFPAASALRLMRHTICTIYICSALSRISPVPQQGISGMIVSELLHMGGADALLQDTRMLRLLCGLVTAGEFFIGVLLLIRRSQSAGIVAAVLLHLLLVLALGPFGLDHHPAVLLWNVGLLCMVPLLFAGHDADRTPASGSPIRPATYSERAALVIAWMFPLSGLIGIADNWLSWQVYSPRPEQWTCFIHVDDRMRLPVALRRFAGDPMPLSDWFPIGVERWSLESTRTPLYPEDRFQLAIIESVLASIPGGCRFQVRLSEPVSVFWWIRGTRQIVSIDELRDEHRRCLLNSEIQH